MNSENFSKFLKGYLKLFFLIFFLLVGIFLSSLVNAVDLQTLPEEKILKIPTYDNSNQVVHPDILFAPNKINDYFYYLVFTPYPFSKDKYENPSILGSNDGLEFKELRKGLNPLVGAPKYDHNNDPDIFYNSQDKKFYLFYLETLRPKFQNLNLLTSTNTLDWQKETVISYNLKKGDEFILSPSVAEKDGLFYLFFVGRSGSELKIKYYVSNDLKKWNKDQEQIADLGLLNNFSPWHLNIVPFGREYYLLVNGLMGKEKNQSLFIGRSDNLKDWYFNKEPLIKPGKGFYNTKDIYRSTGLVDNENLAVWFSFQSRKGNWGVGIKKFKLNKIFSGWEEIKEKGIKWTRLR